MGWLSVQSIHLENHLTDLDEMLCGGHALQHDLKIVLKTDEESIKTLRCCDLAVEVVTME